MIKGLGDKLQQLRLQLKLSQKEVAVAINTSPSIISNYESGERTPSVENLMALANLYHCSTDYLLGFSMTDNDNTIDVSIPVPPKTRQMPRMQLTLPQVWNTSQN